MTWIDDEDVCSALTHLLEAKGSIGAMMDLADEKQASALLENHRRVNCAIDILLDAEKKRRKNELAKHVMERTKETR